MIEELKKINERLLLENDNNIKEKEKYLINLMNIKLLCYS